MKPAIPRRFKGSAPPPVQGCPKSPKRCPECAETLSEIDRNAVRFEPKNANKGV